MVKPIDLSRILKIQLDFYCLHIYMHVLHIYCSQLSSEKKLHYEIIPKGKYSLNAALTCEFTCIIYINKKPNKPQWELENFTTDVIQTKKFTVVKYDTVIWIIHDKLTHSLVVQWDQRTEMQKTNNVFILSVCLPSTTRVMVINICSLDC